ncbi:MAG TPA: hypothetical protein VN903_38205 [Polyangia bacterium]|nr:hypothetical protein [Polyangia bacterium]
MSLAAVAAVALCASPAFAKVEAGAQGVAPLPKASTLADNVVVTPSGQTAPAPQPAPTVNVQPVQPVQPVVEPAPVVAPQQRTVINENEHHNYVATVAVSAIMGAVLGVLVGGAIYYLDTPRHDPGHVGYWAAGGVLAGAGIGVINVIVDESRAERSVATRLPSDPVPTYRVSLLQTRF